MEYVDFDVELVFECFWYGVDYVIGYWGVDGELIFFFCGCFSCGVFVVVFVVEWVVYVCCFGVVIFVVVIIGIGVDVGGIIFIVGS